MLRYKLLKLTKFITSQLIFCIRKSVLWHTHDSFWLFYSVGQNHKQTLPFYSWFWFGEFGDFAHPSYLNHNNTSAETSNLHLCMAGWYRGEIQIKLNIKRAAWRWLYCSCTSAHHNGNKLLCDKQKKTNRNTSASVRLHNLINDIIAPVTKPIVTINVMFY